MQTRWGYIDTFFVQKADTTEPSRAYRFESNAYADGEQHRGGAKNERRPRGERSAHESGFNRARMQCAAADARKLVGAASTCVEENRAVRETPLISRRVARSSSPLRCLCAADEGAPSRRLDTVLAASRMLGERVLVFRQTPRSRDASNNVTPKDGSLAT
ncbi:hypothetical protein MRX96_040601 [Rhipicephalus microplus]